MKSTVVFMITLLILGTPFDQTARTITIKDITIGGPSPLTMDNLKKGFGVDGELSLIEESASIKTGGKYSIYFNNLLPMSHFKYTSDDEYIATVDNETGVVTGVGKGTTYINCTVYQQDTTEITFEFQITVK
jgi:hypothetical protein